MNTELSKQYDHVYKYDFNAVDIREHLQTLKELASECEIVTEFGFRLGASFTALLMGEPDILRTYDIHIPQDAKDGLTKLSGDTIVEFVEASTLDVYIPITDLLFIDTLHTYSQLKKELELHGDRARKYLAFHDTKGQMDKVFANPSSVTALQLLAMALVTRAITGDTRAAEFCVSWIAGKVPDVTIHKDKDEQTLAITSLGAELIQMVKDKDVEPITG